MRRQVDRHLQRLLKDFDKDGHRHMHVTEGCSRGRRVVGPITFMAAVRRGALVLMLNCLVVPPAARCI